MFLREAVGKPIVTGHCQNENQKRQFMSRLWHLIVASLFLPLLARQEESPVSAPPAPTRQNVQQWTLRLSKALIEHVKRVAHERRLNPSELVEEWLWQKAHEKPHE